MAAGHPWRLGHGRDRLPAGAQARPGRQAWRVPAELRDPAEPLSVRARRLARDDQLHRDERGRRLRDLAACFDGYETWLNTVPRGKQYHAGDAWGCVGRWFAGRWRTSAALGYIAKVKQYLKEKIWLEARLPPDELIPPPRLGSSATTGSISALSEPKCSSCLGQVCRRARKAAFRPRKSRRRGASPLTGSVGVPPARQRSR